MLLHEAERIGFPLLIKASAGGGGKGMREVHNAADFLEQLAGARREAQASFGDATVLLERLILQPRHIEIQVLGDNFGNLIHLCERECSIQRRHQKIIEESPSTALTPALRSQMGAAAVRIAEAARYVNAGTLEFMFDRDRQFYFLEMNTRLQVEHPVTELVTGIDLVRHQILIAAGQSLDIVQEQISPRGHAIEVRLYAEDPENNFVPSTGTVTRFVAPTGPGIRIDSGIASGDEITQFYDPMIAKLIVYGEDRPAAIQRLQHALEETAVFGVKTNASLLYAIATHPAFEEGYTYTNFLDEYGLLNKSNSSKENLLHEALLAAAFYDIVGNGEVDTNSNASATNRASPQRLNSFSMNPWKTLGPWRIGAESRGITYFYQDQKYNVAMWPLPDTAGTWSIQIDDQPAEEMTCIFGNDGLVLLRQGTEQVRAHVQHSDGMTHVVLHGHSYRLERRQPPNVDVAAQGAGAARSQKALTAPMAGTIVKVQVRDGQKVQQRQVLVILSAMKMEHSITAPYEGKVKRVYYHEGDVVKGGAVVVEME
jgi:3-methylcrotonyl-CoA carboxylase alpha subunit